MLFITFLQSRADTLFTLVLHLDFIVMLFGWTPTGTLTEVIEGACAAVVDGAALPDRLTMSQLADFHSLEPKQSLQISNTAA